MPGADKWFARLGLRGSGLALAALDVGRRGVGRRQNILGAEFAELAIDELAHDEQLFNACAIELTRALSGR